MGDVSDNSNSGMTIAKGGSRTAELISPKHMDIEGYKVQSEMVIEGFDRLIMGREERKESRGCSPEPELCGMAKCAFIFFSNMVSRYVCST